ncbi:type IV pilus twitching motility protein PilT [Marinithermus hydrothermalis]|uniref:Twitching motility protein n=1 Tax=Marinithermus hydrothermalis (strain DSM 14884 / JCM 11576 / T1) TaxID=869210 RepID=F2NNI2_MARHT|nr:PilT/PilU family type 4a pilus ATPase [Marinithermus hydrothermalis]AEB10997.1 twitching motility protein [Marinithermus hydrothermalis DSM 14884]
MTVVEMLKAMVQQRASDIHLHAGAPPTMRVDGKLKPFTNKALTPREVEAIVRSLLTPEQWELFEYQKEMDFAYTIPGVARFRCNLLRQRGSVGLVMRVVAEAIPSFETLGLPREVMEYFAAQERGLVLVTGPTGSGKSTTLAALIDHINVNYARNIISIEDSIEFLHKNKKSLVIQREVGVDTDSFQTGLKYAMRQDPDVILIGEMRDRETVEAAITAAQTGHLVFSTLHTLDTIRTINRIIDFFPLHEHRQVRTLLAESLLGILSQRLLPRADGQGRVLALEVLVATPLIREYIKDEEKTPQIKEALMEDNLKGMRTFDQHLVELYTEGLITLEDAQAAATSAHEFKLLLTRRTGQTY